MVLNVVMDCQTQKKTGNVLKIQERKVNAKTQLRKRTKVVNLVTIKKPWLIMIHVQNREVVILRQKLVNIVFLEILQQIKTVLIRGIMEHLFLGPNGFGLGILQLKTQAWIMMYVPGFLQATILKPAIVVLAAEIPLKFLRETFYKSFC